MRTWNAAHFLKTAKPGIGHYVLVNNTSEKTLWAAGKLFWYRQQDFLSLLREFSDRKLKQKGFFHSVVFRTSHYKGLADDKDWKISLKTLHTSPRHKKPYKHIRYLSVILNAGQYKLRFTCGLS